MLADMGKHRVKHVHGEPSGIGIVARAMIAIEKQLAAGQHVPGAMLELAVPGLQTNRREGSCMGDGTERKDGCRGRQTGQFVLQKTVAGAYFNGQRLVLWRQAFDRIGDAAIFQSQTIVGTDRYRFGGESESVERLIQ